ncbi:MAG: PASTA domain-containing protein [Alphaproteobacteria bacterium]|nr:PASTA domain-containing protein [Alphaproteobacteria bacterium]
MIVSGTLRSAEGEPLAGRLVMVVTPDGGEARPLGETTTEDSGAFRVELADVPAFPVLGLWVDDRPALCTPQSVDGDLIELGELVFREDAPLMKARLFPAADGALYGVSAALVRAASVETATTREATTETATTRESASLSEATTTRESASLSEASTTRESASLSEATTTREEAATAESATSTETATTTETETTSGTATTREDTTAAATATEAPQQLSRTQELRRMILSTGEDVASAGRAMVEEDSPYVLGDVKIRIKGVVQPGEDKGVEVAFLTESSLGKVDAANLSEIELSYTPTRATGASTVTEGPTIPDVVGYTRDLAVRKLTAQGLHAEVSRVAVDMSLRRSHSMVGRVVRQSPAAGTPATAGARVRLFVGMADR